MQRFISNDEQVHEKVLCTVLYEENRNASLQITQISSTTCKVWMMVQGNFLQVHLNRHTDPALKQSCSGLAGKDPLVVLGTCLGLWRCCGLGWPVAPLPHTYALLWHLCASDLWCGTQQSTAKHTRTCCMECNKILCSCLVVFDGRHYSSDIPTPHFHRQY